MWAHTHTQASLHTTVETPQNTQHHVTRSPHHSYTHTNKTKSNTQYRCGLLIKNKAYEHVAVKNLTYLSSYFTSHAGHPLITHLQLQRPGEGPNTKPEHLINLCFTKQFDQPGKKCHSTEGEITSLRKNQHVGRSEARANKPS